jgi:pyocin large subunit-like protein
MPGLCLATLLAAAFASQVAFAPQPSAQGNFGAASQQTVRQHRIWTGNEAGENRHWKEHGLQFPQFADEQAYVQGAEAFVTHPPPGTLIKHRANGDTLYFDPASDMFAVMADDGAVRTFFKPDDGMAYWNRQ